VNALWGYRRHRDVPCSSIVQAPQLVISKSGGGQAKNRQIALSAGRATADKPKTESSALSAGRATADKPKTEGSAPLGSSVRHIADADGYGYGHVNVNVNEDTPLARGLLIPEER
jgi:hypothetical protein